MEMKHGALFVAHLTTVTGMVVQMLTRWVTWRRAQRILVCPKVQLIIFVVDKEVNWAAKAAAGALMSTKQ